MKKIAKWIAICMVAIMALFAFGCDNGSSDSTPPTMMISSGAILLEEIPTTVIMLEVILTKMVLTKMILTKMILSIMVCLSWISTTW